MKKEKVVERKITEIEYLCDRCGEKITHQYASRRCSICGRDVCDKCAHWFETHMGLNEPYFNCDNPEAVCKICWNEGEEIRKKIMESRERQEKEENDLIQEWTNLCSK